MKKNLQKILFCFCILITALPESKAQQKLIHYWHFNNFNSGVTVPVNPSTLTVANADYSSLDTTKARIYYRAIPGTSSSYLTYWDGATTGDTVNIRLGQTAGKYLRTRNPSDSMQLLFYIPSIHYKNITIKYEVQKSSAGNGAGIDSFSYSLDSGATWKTSGLSSVYSQVLYYSGGTPPWPLAPITTNISADTLANNNSKLVFRIKFAITDTGTSGNNRFDNFTVEGDTQITSSLPVNLLSFNAIAQNDKNVLLSWQTASEINNDHFDIERSASGNNFKSIGSIRGNGNSNSLQNYSFTDANAPEEEICYRLVQKDFDGNVNYSDVICLNNVKNKITGEVLISPNPVNDELNISLPANGIAGVEITDVTGKIMLVSSFVNKLKINTADLKEGIYFVRVQGEQQVVVKKIIKQ